MLSNISIYEAIGRNIGDVLVKGVPTNCIGSTLESISLVYPLEQQLRGKELFIYEGSGDGQSRVISDFVPGSNFVVLDPIFSTVPTSDSRFIIFNHFQVDDYENAMNRAMGFARLLYLDERVATLQLVGTQYEYPVPSGFEYVNNIHLVPSGSTDYRSDDEVTRLFDIASRLWHLQRNAVGTPMIVFDPRKISIAPLNEEMVNVVGQVKPEFTATAMPENLQEFIISRASSLLSARLIGEGSEWKTKFGYFKNQSDNLEKYIYRPRRGKRVI